MTLEELKALALQHADSNGIVVDTVRLEEGRLRYTANELLMTFEVEVAIVTSASGQLAIVDRTDDGLELWYTPEGYQQFLAGDLDGVLAGVSRPLWESTYGKVFI